MTTPASGSVRTRALVAVVLFGAITWAACGDDDASAPGPSATSITSSPPTRSDTVESADQQLFPDVIGVSVTADGDAFRFDVTVSSPYDTPGRYADAWRIVAPDGRVLGVRELAHDHAGEQPFTRSLTGVVIPDDVTMVTVEGRDLVNGWGGGTQVVSIDR